MLAEGLYVGRADRLGVGGIDEEHPGANDVSNACAKFIERTEDDLEAPPRLSTRSGVDLAIGGDGRRTGDQDPVSDPKGSAKPDLVLKW